VVLQALFVTIMVLTGFHSEDDEGATTGAFLHGSKERVTLAESLYGDMLIFSNVITWHPGKLRPPLGSLAHLWLSRARHLLLRDRQDTRVFPDDTRPNLNGSVNNMVADS